MRNILLLPDEFRLWTSPAIDDMLTVNVNSITPFQLCKEVYGNKAKSAPFSLSPLRVQIDGKITNYDLPVNSSIKRSAFGHCIAQVMKLDGATRKTIDFKNSIASMYTGIDKNVKFVIVIKTNTLKRLASITNPLSAYPARKIVE